MHTPPENKIQHFRIKQNVKETRDVHKTRLQRRQLKKKKKGKNGIRSNLFIRSVHKFFKQLKKKSLRKTKLQLNFWCILYYMLLLMFF